MAEYPDLSKPVEVAPRSGSYPDLSQPVGDFPDLSQPQYPDLSESKNEVLSRDFIKNIGKLWVDREMQNVANPATKLFKSVMLALPADMQKVSGIDIGKLADEAFKFSPPEILKRFVTPEQKDAIAEIAGYGALGFVEGYTANLPGAVAKLAGKELAEEPTLPGELGRSIGSLAGFWLGPAKWLKGAFNTVGLNKWNPQTWGGVWAKRVVQDSALLGTYNFLSEWGGENIIDVSVNKFGAAAYGVAQGTMFGTIGNIMSEKYPVISLALRLGLNEYTVLSGTTGSINPTEIIDKSKSIPLPKLLFESGLAVLFGLGAQNPRKEAFANRARVKLEQEFKELHRLDSLDSKTLEKQFLKIGDIRKIPVTMKYAYLGGIKEKAGQDKPIPGFKWTAENAGSVDYLFELALSRKNYELLSNLKLVGEIERGIENKLGRMIRQESVSIEEPQAGITKRLEQVGTKEITTTPELALKIKGPIISEISGPVRVRDLTTGKFKTERRKFVTIAQPIYEQISTVQIAHKGKIIASKDFKFSASGENIVTDYTAMDEGLRQKGTGQFLWRTMFNRAYQKNKNLRLIMGEVSDAGGASLVRDFGAQLIDAKTNQPIKPNLLAAHLAAGNKVNFIIDTRSPDFITSKVGDKAPWLSWLPKELAKQENDLRKELATGVDIAELHNTARAAQLVYKAKDGEESFTKFNNFLMQFFGFENKAQLGKLTKEQVSIARKYLKALRPNKWGEVEIPTTKEMVPLGYFDQVERIETGPDGTLMRVPKSMNPIEWLQSGRIALKEIYDILKPARLDFEYRFEKRRAEVNAIFDKKVSEGSESAKRIDMYTDGKYNFSDLTKAEQKVAIGVQKYMGRLLSEMVSDGVIPPESVKMPFYRSKMENWIIKHLHGEDQSYAEWERMSTPPLAGQLRPRAGLVEHPYNINRTLERHTIAIEKYRAMSKATEQAEHISDTMYTGTRRKLAKVFIDSMNDRPSSQDVALREGVMFMRDSMTKILDHAGLHKAADRMRNWDVPAKPFGKIAGSMARIYYFRYIGFAQDTAFKNAFQWEHAAARHGWQNTQKAMYMRHTHEGKQLVKQMRIHEEGVQRGHHFIEEAGERVDFKKIENAAYYTWQKTDVISRDIAGLAAYYDALTPKPGKPFGESHLKAIELGRKSALETQFGYTKADSLLIDMASPWFRFVLFKKWPMAKVEMLRSWIRDGRVDAVTNLAMQEYLIYKAGQAVGIDMTNFFNSIWQLATNGMSGPYDMVPMLGEFKDIVTSMFGDNVQDRDKAAKQLIRVMRGLGIRYFGKMRDVWDAWVNEWEVHDILDDSFVRMTSPGEQFLGLLATPQAKSEFYDNEDRKRKLDDEVSNMTRKIERLFIAGDHEKAFELHKQRDEKYSEIMASYGKILSPITADDIKRRIIIDNMPKAERTRRGMAGHTIYLSPEEGEWPETKKSIWEFIK